MFDPTVLNCKVAQNGSQSSARRNRGMPHVAKVSGYRDLWELRVISKGRAFRLFFAPAGSELVLLHAVEKKARRLAPKEFALAAERLQDWKRRRAQT